MLEVGGDDACVVSSVPARRCRAGDERHPQPDRRRGHLASSAGGTGAAFTSIAQEPLVHQSRGHHGLPGGSASTGLRTPRSVSHRMNDIAARRKGRCCGARPSVRGKWMPPGRDDPPGRPARPPPARPPWPLRVSGCRFAPVWSKMCSACSSANVSQIHRALDRVELDIRRRDQRRRKRLHEFGDVRESRNAAAAPRRSPTPR